MQLTVLKRSGATEPFTREKAVAGVRKACKGRPVSEDDLACLGQAVEDALRTAGWAEVPAHEVGLAILAPLRELDEVAYLRFASVYRAFESRRRLRDRDRAAARRPRLSAVTSRPGPTPTHGRDPPAHGLTTICPVRRGEAARRATSSNDSTSTTDTREHGT